MRAIAGLLGLLAMVAGAYGAFLLQRAVGPEAPSAAAAPGTTPGGDAATPGDTLRGSLFEPRNVRRILSGMAAELGPAARVDYFDLRADSASAGGRRPGGRVVLQADARGTINAYGASADRAPATTIPFNRIRAEAIARIVRRAPAESGGRLESLTLTPYSREWYVRMDGGEPDTMVANLDGRGLRLPGEPDPQPTGAAADSLLRAGNLRRVLRAIRRDAGGGAVRLAGLDIRPLRAGAEITRGARRLRLGYDVDVRLTQRDVSAGGVEAGSISLSAIRPGAVERMAAAARRRKRSLGLGKVDYVVLQPRGFLGDGPSWTIYFKDGSHFFATLRGADLRRPGE